MAVTSTLHTEAHLPDPTPEPSHPPRPVPHRFPPRPAALCPLFSGVHRRRGTVVLLGYRELYNLLTYHPRQI